MMQQRDIIKDEIEQLGRALGKVLANFFALKNKGAISLAVEVTNQNLQSEIDLDINKLALLNEKEMEDYVQSKKLTDRHLDQLATYVFEIGISKKGNLTGTNRLKWFRTAKRLLELVEKISNTITFERISLKEKVEREIKHGK